MIEASKEEIGAVDWMDSTSIDYETDFQLCGGLSVSTLWRSKSLLGDDQHSRVLELLFLNRRPLCCGRLYSVAHSPNCSIRNVVLSPCQ
jgi:hypothetical protein